MKLSKMCIRDRGQSEHRQRIRAERDTGAVDADPHRLPDAAERQLDLAVPVLECVVKQIVDHLLDLCLLYTSWDGFVAIQDPLRKDVYEAVKKCRSAGVDIKMLTGDNLVTASALSLIHI